MRCEICDKIVKGKLGYQSHLRQVHRELSHSQRLEILKRLFPRNQKSKRYKELKDRLRAGEFLTEEEFAIVKAVDQCFNQSRRGIYGSEHPGGTRGERNRTA